MDLTENMLALEPIGIWTLGLFWGSLTQALHTTTLTMFLDLCPGIPRSESKEQRQSTNTGNQAKRARQRRSEGKPKASRLADISITKTEKPNRLKPV